MHHWNIGSLNLYVNKLCTFLLVLTGCSNSRLFIPELNTAYFVPLFTFFFHQQEQCSFPLSFFPHNNNSRKHNWGKTSPAEDDRANTTYGECGQTSLKWLMLCFHVCFDRLCAHDTFVCQSVDWYNVDIYLIPVGLWLYSLQHRLE